ncbi:MAG: hypothetical protein ABIP71_06145 [Verrucomicrobiota bacterium]
MKFLPERSNPITEVPPQTTRIAFSDALRFAPAVFFTICFACAWALRANQHATLANLCLLISSAIATLLALNQRLPLQNIVSLVTVITLFSGTSMLASAWFKTKLFPPFFMGKFPAVAVWASPLLWVIALVNARAIGQLLLRPIQKTPFYGLWLMAVASLIAASFNLAVKNDWQNITIQVGMAALVFVAATPWFIDKRRVEQLPEYQPLVIIGLLLFW